MHIQISNTRTHTNVLLIQSLRPKCSSITRSQYFRQDRLKSKVGVRTATHSGSLVRLDGAPGARRRAEALPRKEGSRVGAGTRRPKIIHFCPRWRLDTHARPQVGLSICATGGDSARKQSRRSFIGHRWGLHKYTRQQVLQFTTCTTGGNGIPNKVEGHLYVTKGDCIRRQCPRSFIGHRRQRKYTRQIIYSMPQAGLTFMYNARGHLQVTDGTCILSTQ